MPRVRLTGLFLFITAIFLGLASAATQTSHLRFKSPDFSGDSNSSGDPSETDPGLPPTTSTSPDTASSAEMPNAGTPPAPIRFISIPMLYPLTGVGLLGLALWFVPGGLEEVARSRSRNKSKSRGTSSRRRATTKGLSLLASRNARRKKR